MRWKGGNRSRHIEDRRHQALSTGGAGRGIMLMMAMRLVRSKFGFIGVIALAAGLYLFGGYSPGNLFALLTGRVPTSTQITHAPYQESESEKYWAELVSVVLKQTEDTWEYQLSAYGQTYKAPTLVYFRKSTPTACGLGQAATGPFYCPADQRVYIDLSFLDSLRELGGNTSDFSAAYVIAHEVGHHVQTITGIEAKMRQAQKSHPALKNTLSVKLELQADCFAGIWAYTYNQQNPGAITDADLQQGLQMAAAIGDDALQKRAGRTVSPDSFTHGTAKERAYWLKHGATTGDLKSCDTFTE